MRPTVIITLLIVSLVSSTAMAGLYRWVDENGVTHYGDRVPPRYANKRRERINEQGRTISVQERERTQQEREADERQRREALARQAQAERQAKYDRSLTSTYDDVEQLDRAYTDRLDIVDGKIRAASKVKTDIQRALKPLYERADSDNAETGLDKRIAQNEARLQEQNQIIERLNEQRRQIATQREVDRERYLTLTGQSASN